MRTLFLRFACLLTGYDFPLIMRSAVLSRKRLVKYTSAMLMVCQIWALVAYYFASHYLRLGTWGAVASAVLAVLMIVWFDRQILLDYSGSKAKFVLRAIVALAMSLLGAVLVDQKIFADDIAIARQSRDQQRIDTLVEQRRRLLDEQVAQLTGEKNRVETQLAAVSAQLKAEPFQNQTSSTMVAVMQPKQVPTGQLDANGNPVMQTVMSQVLKPVVSTTQVANPLNQQQQILSSRLQSTSAQLVAKDSALLALEKNVRTEVTSRQGFIDELNALLDVVVGSPAAMAVYFLWMAILLAFETILLVGKWNEQPTDYDHLLRRQMEANIRRTEKLAAGLPA